MRLADGFGTQREQSSARFVAVSAVLVIHLLLALLFLRASLGPKVRRSRGEVLADILNLVRLPQQAPRGAWTDPRNRNFAAGAEALAEPEGVRHPWHYPARVAWSLRAAAVENELVSLSRRGGALPDERAPPAGSSRFRRAPHLAIPGLHAATAIRLGPAADSCGA